jgi:hypothetical protein
MKTGAKTLIIKEQVYKDASGITFQFLFQEGSEHPYRILLLSDDLPFGNRELSIDSEVMVVGGGTVITYPED